MWKYRFVIYLKKKKHVAYLIKYAQCCCLLPVDNSWSDYASASVYIYLLTIALFLTHRFSLLVNHTLAQSNVIHALWWIPSSSSSDAEAEWWEGVQTKNDMLRNNAVSSHPSKLTDVMSQQGTTQFAWAILFKSKATSASCHLQKHRHTNKSNSQTILRCMNETDSTTLKGYWTGRKSRGLYTWASHNARCPWLVPAASNSTRTCSTAHSGGRTPL